jgi:hypothetical protein
MRIPWGPRDGVAAKLAAPRSCVGSRPIPQSSDSPCMPTARKKTTRKTAPKQLSIEETWRRVDRLCRAIWSAHYEDAAPSSLAVIISTLRDEKLVPHHEANMMHTIRAFRNIVVHEDANFGTHETVIARAAFEIIGTWAKRDARGAWRKMLKQVE